MNRPRYHAPDEETLDRSALASLQRGKLAVMFRQVMAGNRFYQHKFAGIAFDPLKDPLETLPFTTRAELEADQLDHPPYGSNLSEPIEHYCRLHQTSGSAGRPLRWLDTANNWQWWKRCWAIIFTAAGVTPRDRIFFPFSFGPFVGFWGAFDGAVALGNLALPGGGMTTVARLRFMIENDADIVCCTPTYALRMAEVALQENIDLKATKVRALIVAGEPGGSIPETRSRIEYAWGARVYDHTGMTEIGPLGFECEQAPGGVHLSETECIAEIIDPETGRPAADGKAGELVITNLGRAASPVIRYRTGDEVRVTHNQCACGRWMARMEGGILGRIDDMFVVRGNNVFPSALEGIIRTFGDVAEFAVEVSRAGPLPRVQLRIEPAAGVEVDGLAERVARTIHDRLSFRAEVIVVPGGELPRYEFKAHRYVRRD